MMSLLKIVAQDAPGIAPKGRGDPQYLIEKAARRGTMRVLQEQAPNLSAARDAAAADAVKLRTRINGRR